MGFKALALLMMITLTLTGCSVLGGTTTIDPSDVLDGMIAYVSEVDGVSNIFVMNADGSNPINVSQGLNGTTPSLSPDGSKIAFESEANGNTEVFVINTDGSNPVNLTNHSSRDRSPAWSPDGTKIAFESNRDASGDVFVMNEDGSNLVNLTNGTGLNIAPNWSPDGSKIVFASNRNDGIQNLFVMDADGSNQTLLFESTVATYQPSWSPTGDQIAFMRGSRIWLVNAHDGEDLIQLTTPEMGSSQKPTFSPDGSKVAFRSVVGGVSDIYVINLDGTGFRKLTSSGVGNTLPSWSKGE